MVTIHRQSGLRFIIFSDDHELAHVHVFGDGHMKVNIAGSGGVIELVWADGMKRNDIRKAMRIVNDNRARFLRHWKDIHDRPD